MAPRGRLCPPGAQPVQDQMPIGIGAEELATDAAKCVPPFFSTRRRCSRLIVGTMRWRMRYARNLAKLQRPNGSPRVVGAWSARRQMAAICCFDKRGGAPSLRGRLSAARPCRANSRRSVETVLDTGEKGRKAVINGYILSYDARTTNPKTRTEGRRPEQLTNQSRTAIRVQGEGLSFVTKIQPTEVEGMTSLAPGLFDIAERVRSMFSHACA